MSHERFEKLAAVFEHARGLGPDARREYLDQACGDDSELRERVVALLARHDRQGVLDDPIASPGGPSDSDPERIGHFRIIERLGRGGMGVVYRAEQDQPRRLVALKMIHASLLTDELRRRFEFEAGVLARLMHPSIAQIYEVGTWDGGDEPRPFFAMELVDGVALDEYVTRSQPSMEPRLRLFIAICDAVQHAHQKGVIHRDLKPANILVTSGGAPKILDFGVARATAVDVQVTLCTLPGQLIGTLAYMSPEQANAATESLDTRSDVYALGVILYELLAGRLPYELAGSSIAGAIRVIEECEPRSPTTLNRALRGDLETIVLKSLRKRPEDRYQSASDLAADIRRFLEHQPIVARPATALYQLSRFARRNRALVAGVAVAFGSLVVGLSMSTYALGVAGRERDENEAVTRFLSEMMASADPAREGRDARVMDLLEAASQRVGLEFGDRPLVAAKLQHVIGTTYGALGVYDRAASHLEDALAVRRQVLGQRALPALDSMRELGTVYKDWGKYDQAQPLLQRALESYAETVGDRHHGTLAAMNELGSLRSRQGRHDLAGPLYQRSLDLMREVLGGEHPDTLAVTNNLGLEYKRMGRFDQAEQLYEEVLSTRRRVLGAEHLQTLTSMNNLAHLYRAQSRHDDAAALHARTLEIRRRVLGNEHPHTQMSMDNLAMLLVDLRRPGEAEPLYAEALELKRRVLGPEHPETFVSMNNLANLYLNLNRLEDSEALHRRTLAVRTRILGRSHRHTATSMVNLARTCAAQQQYDEADRLFTEALELRREVLGENHPEVARCLLRVARMRLQQGRLVEAEAVCREMLAVAEAPPRASRGDLARLRLFLARVLRRQGRWEESEATLLAAHEAISELPETLPYSEVVAELIALYESWDTAVPNQAYDLAARRWRDDDMRRREAPANP